MSKAIVRPATLDDMAAVRSCHSELGTLLGKSLDLPEVGDPALLQCFVVERDGKVIGVMVFEKCVRMHCFGTSAEVMAALRDTEEQIFATSKEAGVRCMICSVPAAMPVDNDISRHLQDLGFDRRQDVVEHTLDLGRVKDQQREGLSQIEAESPFQQKWLM